MAKKKPALLKRLSLFFIALIFLLLTAGYALSVNPQWLGDILVKKLKQQGVEVAISQLTGQWHGLQYDLHAKGSVQFSGGYVSRTKLALRINGQALWQRQHHFSNLAVFIDEGMLDAEALFSKQSANSRKPTNPANASVYEHWLPSMWSLHCSACTLNYQTQQMSGELSVAGQANQAITAKLSGESLGAVNVQYNAKLQTLRVDSEQLNILRLSGESLRLSALHAKLNLDVVMQSELSATLSYQGLESRFQLQGQGNQHSRLDIYAQGDTQTLFLVRDGAQFRLKTARLDTAFLNYIKPALMPLLSSNLPKALRSSLSSLALSGEISGEMLFSSSSDHKASPLSAQLSLTQLGVHSDQYALDNVSGELRYSQNVLTYALQFSDSTLMLADYLPAPLTAIEGDLNGALDWQRQAWLAWLPTHVALRSDGFQSIAIDQTSADLAIDLQLVDARLLEVFKSHLLPLFSQRLPTQIRPLLSTLNLEGKFSLKTLLAAKTYRPKVLEIGLHQLGFNTQGHQLTNLSGNLHRDKEGVAFQLVLDEGVVALPEVFTQPLPPTKASIKGVVDVANRQLTIEQLSLSNKDVDALKVAGSAQFNDKFIVDFTGQASHISLNRLPLYLTKYFPPMTQSFLSKALVSGKKNQGTFQLKGDLAHFMEKGFHFVIDVVANDGVFHYLDNNPDIAVKKTRVKIDGRQLTVDVERGNLFARINKKTVSVPLRGKAVIKDMNAAELEVKANVKPQPLSRLAQLAEHSMAKETIKGINEIATIKGQFALALALDLDLRYDDNKTSFTVRLNSGNAEVNLQKMPQFVVKAAKASAVVNDEGLQLIRIEGESNRRPLSIEIAPFTPSTQAKQSGIAVSATAKQADVLTVLGQLDLLTEKQTQLLKKHQVVTGQTDAQIDLRLADSGDLLEVKVEGDLRNTKIDAFGLLAHQPLMAYPLRVDYQAKKGHCSLSIADELTVEFGFGELGQLQGFLIDNRNGHKPYRQGIGSVNWYAQRFDFEKFKQLYDAWPHETQKKSALLPLETDILIDKVRVNVDVFEPIQIQGSLDNLKIASPLLSGDISYHDNHLQANLGRIEVDSLFNLFKKKEINPEGRTVTKLDLARDLPTLTLQADQLILKGNNVGNATIKTSIQKGHYSIDQLLVSGRDYYFDASGYEVTEPQGLTTHIFADFKGENINSVAKRFGLNEVIDAKFIDASLNLSWPGKASAINLRQGYGKANLNAQNVKLVNLSSRVGSVFGMMDIVGILKRVAMDFDNLNSSKLTFDTIQGNWNIGGGRAMTLDAYARGSLIDLQVTGGADLHRREFDDMALTVIPKASNVIPLIGVVAGGVVGGAAGLLVQQTIGDNINQVAGLPYVISGQWDNPLVTFSGKQSTASNAVQND